ncbi:amidase [Pacificimonas flava]|uniref:Amidase n=3 Tax=Pacificimonas TaxID=1960290 RepID=A0A219B9S7_9SPHN|nr:amidase family protein [Pacificimonas flava]MBZ6378205.1 amidase [Pacificimonas aurantium]OWV34569.1 amidase [Pacificimonas flava]
MTAIETASAVQRGETSARAEVDAAIARIEARDDELNAVVVRRFEDARREADALDRQGALADLPLAGVPMTIKESYDLAGLPTTWGSDALAGFTAVEDALVARRLRAAGAIILGKTNVPPMLADWQSKNGIYGTTHNPHRHGFSPGGSSGGAAAALAAGYVPLEFGSDIGGSIRVPAHFCGVWGHKPTYGVVPMDGHLFPGTDGHEPDMGVGGPLARDPADLELALRLTARHPLAPAAVETLAGTRIAVLGVHPTAPCGDEILASVEAAARAARDAGATIVCDAAWPDLAALHSDYLRLLLTTLGRGQPLPDGVAMPSVEDWWQQLDQQARARRAWDRLFEDVDIVVAPVAGITAFPIDDGNSESRLVEVNGEASPWGLQLAYAGLCNYPGLPGTAMPVSRSSDGLPIGIQVIGPRYEDFTTLGAARMIAAALAK